MLHLDGPAPEPGEGAVTFAGGLAVVEAEDHDVKVPRSSHDWTTGAGSVGVVGTAIQATPDTGARVIASIPTTSPEVGFRVLFPAAGTYQLWVRGYGLSNGNTLHAGRDGQATAENISFATGSWTWVKRAISIPSAGEHTVQLWMREDGIHVDRVLLAAERQLHPGRRRPGGHPARRRRARPDLTPPTLTGRQPAAGATGVDPGANVVATFSEAMDPATLGTGPSRWPRPRAARPCAASVAPSAGNTVLTLDPGADLAPATAYSATVAGRRRRRGQPWRAADLDVHDRRRPAGAAAGAVLFACGLAVVEAEDFDAKVPRAGHDWVAGQSPAGAVAGALKAAPDNGARIATLDLDHQPRARLPGHFPAAGTYHLWLRASRLGTATRSTRAWTGR